MFLLLALGTTALFLWGVREPFSVGWRELARPLVADTIDRLAAEIGSPPDVGRAQALARRLPLWVRIAGPVVNGSSHPDSHNTSHNTSRAGQSSCSATPTSAWTGASRTRQLKRNWPKRAGSICTAQRRPVADDAALACKT